MRIIAGEKRGKRLMTLEGEDTRPTLERVKEGMFSSIQFLLPSATVLDLYAGSGQLGLEALSRGAAHCVFIDQNKEAVATIIQNAKETGLFEKSRVASMGAEAFLAQCQQKFDVVFLDPPFKEQAFPAIIEKVMPVLAPGAIILCESELKAHFPVEIGSLILMKQYRYGTVLVTRYQNKSE